MSDALPEPLVPAHVDLRNFPSMLLDVQRLRDSELAVVEDGEVFRVCVLSWCVAWHQRPAASLPDDDAVLARLLGYGRDVRRWRRARRAGGLRGWVTCSDGRLYHPVVAEKALEAWGAKELQRRRTAASRKKIMERQGLDGDGGGAEAVTGATTETVTGSVTEMVTPASTGTVTGVVTVSKGREWNGSEGNGTEGNGTEGNEDTAAAAAAGGSTPPAPKPPPPPLNHEVQQAPSPDGDDALDRLRACHPGLMVLGEDLASARVTVALYGWRPCSAALAVLEPAAREREPGRRRVPLSELRAWLADHYRLDESDYRRAGLPAPEGG